MGFKDGEELMSWIEDAIGDVADCNLAMMDKKTAKTVNEMNKNGVTDIKGALADELYNDVDTLVDLIGDRIYGLPNRKELLDYCFKYGHTALQEASLKLAR